MAKFTVTSNADKWVQALRAKQQGVAEAAVSALNEMAANAVREGKQDIAASGRFGSKWQSGLLFTTKDESPPSLQAKAVIFHTSGLSGVFEYGDKIHGKPLLWIPITAGAPPPRKSGKHLTSANVHGVPMLFDASNRDPHRRPLYVGVPEATIPQKWHIRDIVKKNVATIGRLFIKYFKG